MLIILAGANGPGPGRQSHLGLGMGPGPCKVLYFQPWPQLVLKALAPASIKSIGNVLWQQGNVLWQLGNVLWQRPVATG